MAGITALDGRDLYAVGLVAIYLANILRGVWAIFWKSLQPRMIREL